jgi:hypothetical protein
MKQLIFITIFFVSLSVKSQTAVKDQIIGNWKVENVIVKSTNKEMVELSQAFRNSIFSQKIRILISRQSKKRSLLLCLQKCCKTKNGFLMRKKNQLELAKLTIIIL